MKFPRIMGLFVVALGVIGAGGVAAAPPSDRGMPIRSDGSSICADVADKVGPAVVFIRTERSMQSAERGQGDTPFEFFREFFPQQDDPHQRLDSLLAAL